MKTSNKILIGTLLFVFLAGLVPMIGLKSIMNDLETSRVEGNSELDSIERAISDYNALVVNGAFTVVVKEGIQAISIEAESNLLEYIETEVREGTLTIRRKPLVSVRFNHQPVITVPYRPLKSMEASGAGILTVEPVIMSPDFDLTINGAYQANLNFQTSKLNCEVSGVSQIDLAGTADEVAIEAHGSSQISAGQLIGKNVRAEANGVVMMEVQATETLNAEASGSSQIHFSGNPATKNIQTSGVAKVVPL